MPEEEKPIEAETALPGVTQEEINQWVSVVDSEDSKSESEGFKDGVKGIIR